MRSSAASSALKYIGSINNTNSLAAMASSVNEIFAYIFDSDFTLWKFNVDGSQPKLLQRKITSISSLDLEHKY